MDTKVLEYLIAIAEEKNISRAADLFYLTQPVLSRQVKNVEQELGTKLFCRTEGEMRLTDAGRIYINQARAILYTEQQMEQALEDLRREKRRVLRVMVDPYLLRLFNRSVLPAFEELDTGFELLTMLEEDSQKLAARDLHELLRAWENYHRLWTVRLHMQHIAFREETRYPGFYYRADFMAIDDKKWKCFVNSRFDPVKGETTFFKKPYIQLIPD